MSVNGDATRDPAGLIGISDDESNIPLQPHSQDIVGQEDLPPARLKRNLKPTEKGKVYQLNNLRTHVKALYKRLTQQMTIVDTLLTSENIDLIQTEATNLDRINVELCDAHARLGTMFEEDDTPECTELSAFMEEADTKYFEYKQKICTWLIQQDRRVRDSDGAKSERSHKLERSVMSRRSDRSRSSRNSRGSSVTSQCSNLSVMQKAKIEGLKAEATAIKKTK